MENPARRALKRFEVFEWGGKVAAVAPMKATS